MSPRDLDRTRLHAHLRRLRELLDDLEQLVGPVTGDDLQRDRARRYTAERILTQLVEVAAAINSHIAAALLGRAPRDYAGSFDDAARAGAISEDLANELRGSGGLRNVLVHQYLEIDYGRVADAIPQALDGFRRFNRAVASFIRSLPDAPDRSE